MFNHLITSAKSIDGKKVGINYVLNSALAPLFEPITFSWNVGVFKGNVYKHKGMVHFEGLLTITTAVTSYNTVIASLYNRGITLETFLLIGYVDNASVPIYFYPSGYNVLSRSNLSVGTKIYINSVVPL